ncbi:hypothetical protein L9F63_009983, partial [Diploptera punctata]
YIDDNVQETCGASVLLDNTEPMSSSPIESPVELSATKESIISPLNTTKPVEDTNALKCFPYMDVTNKTVPHCPLETNIPYREDSYKLEDNSAIKSNCCVNVSYRAKPRTFNERTNNNNDIHKPLNQIEIANLTTSHCPVPLPNQRLYSDVQPSGDLRLTEADNLVQLAEELETLPEEGRQVENSTDRSSEEINPELTAAAFSNKNVCSHNSNCNIAGVLSTSKENGSLSQLLRTSHNQTTFSQSSHRKTVFRSEQLVSKLHNSLRHPELITAAVLAGYCLIDNTTNET